MTGAVYILAEGAPTDIARLQNCAETPQFFKVGSAVNAKSSSSAQVQSRLHNLQSCNVEPLGAIRVFEFPDRQAAVYAEASFHEAFRERYGVRVNAGHEWYHGKLTIDSACRALEQKGGINITSQLSAQLFPARYEIDFGEAHSVQLCALELQQSGVVWWKLVACGYTDGTITSAYNTGNPRRISVVRNVKQPAGNVGWISILENSMREQQQQWLPHQNSISARAPVRKLKFDWHYTGWVPKHVMEPLFIRLREALSRSG